MAKVGEGVHDIYKERARSGGDVLWHVTIKGQKELAEGIPLHMSLKVFADKKDMNLDEIKKKVKEFKIKTPNPADLKFKTTVFTSERDGKEYYMLLIEGVDDCYSRFYDSLKHCGTVYKKFMPHVTIDKGLYERINQEGLKPEEVSFKDLSIEHGAGNTVHEFKSFGKSEDIRETIFLSSDLENYRKAVCLSDSFLTNYLQDNPGLEEAVIKKYEERLMVHFGNNQELIQIAWKDGIKKAYESLRK